MKKVLAAVCVGVAANAAYAMPVSESTALIVGKNYMAKFGQSAEEPKLLATYMDNSATHPAIYVFSANSGNGFVIVSGDDAVRPILGYSNENSFPIDNMSPEVSYWMEYYRKQISDVIASSMTASQEIAQRWGNLVAGTEGSVARKGTAVPPLVATNWDQGTYYNKFCPGSGSSKAPTGCVATAMAIIMKYWNAPAVGTGSYSYVHGTYGSQSANFGETTYEWGLMPNTLNSSSTTESVDAVATLMYHAGVAVRMDYSPSGSGAQVIGWGSYPSARKAFKDYFGYKTTIQGIYREDYTTTEWINTLKDQIDNGLPILYAGFDDGFGAGHAFVFSGYNDDNMFHINWGWSGYYNGYFTVDDLNPDGSGIGGGSGSYNDGQQALINIEPLGEGVMFDLKLNAPIEASALTVAPGEPFSVTANIANVGTMDFMGRYTAAVYDADSNFKAYVQHSPTLTTLQDAHTEFTFESSGLSFANGTYFIKILYRATTASAWTILPDGSGFVNRINLIIDGEPMAAEDVLTLASAISLYPNPATKVVNVDLSAIEANITGINVISATGAKMFAKDLAAAAHVAIPLDGIAAGVYFVSITTDRGLVTKQFVVK
jgi:hypothetical protein